MHKNLELELITTFTVFTTSNNKKINKNNQKETKISEKY